MPAHAHREKSSGKSWVVSVAIGCGVSFGCMLLLLLGFSAMIASGSVPESQMLLCVLLSVAVGVFLGSLVATGLHKSRILISGLLVGGVHFAVLFILGLLLFYPNMSHVPGMLLVALAFSLGGAALRLIRPKHRTRKRLAHR